MKRMIEGIVNCLAESGGYRLYDDGEIAVDIIFRFPEGYWPFYLNSKPFGIFPGKIVHGNESDISSSCFHEGDDTYWNAVSFVGDDINEGYGYNEITYNFKFGNEANRSAFLKELFGKDIIGQQENITPFAVPVSMLLVAFDGVMSY